MSSWIDYPNLNKPKIKDMVAFLLTLDQEKEILLDDPDTGRDITIIHVYENEGKLFLTGKYGEMRN